VEGERGRLTLARPFTPARTEAVVRIKRGDETLERRFAAVDQYQLEIEHFADCVREGRAPALPLEDALEQAEAIEAVYGAAGYEVPW
jgi:D-xylose 1-dehydrogenase (NADP+, D-xylono-1,5-lactone-forming)